jgi:hypothetical protein
MLISITLGPSVVDPMDQAPIIISGWYVGTVNLTARTWSSRLGIYLLRRYVRKITEAK